MTQNAEFMDKTQLKAEIRRLQQTIDDVKQITQEWLDKQSHERCWWYPELFQSLAAKLGLVISVDPALPPRSEFEAGCKRYQNEEFGDG